MFPQIFQPHLEHLDAAAEALKTGELVAFPTETVYGLGANATNQEAVTRIFEAKSRPHFNPLITHYRSLSEVMSQAEVTPEAKKIMDVFSPGPLTVVLNKKADSTLTSLATAGLETVAVRIPAHPIAQALLERLPFPVAAPSANPSESLSPTEASHVEKAFRGSNAFKFIIEGGRCACGLESTIIDCTKDQPLILREGPLTFEELQQVVPHIKRPSIMEASGKLTAPGQMKRHYAPQVQLRMNATSVNPSEALLAFGKPLEGGARTLNLSPSSDLREAAGNFFAMLHALDRPDLYRGIAVMPLPEAGLGGAMNDRLRRGAVTPENHDK